MADAGLASGPALPCAPRLVCGPWTGCWSGPAGDAIAPARWPGGASPGRGSVEDSVPGAAGGGEAVGMDGAPGAGSMSLGWGAACDLVVDDSWPGVMSMCHRTASGGSAPQIGSSRDSAGSCVGALSPTGPSGDIPPSCAGPGPASRPPFSPAGGASAVAAPLVVPFGGDADCTDVPCSRGPLPARFPGRGRRRNPNAAKILLRKPPERASWTWGASSGGRLMALASLHDYEAVRGTQERRPGARAAAADVVRQAGPGRYVARPPLQPPMPEAEAVRSTTGSSPLLASSIPQQPTTPS